ncbi:2-nitropropane dioxygenase [Novosphingobium marinum]|uniref:Nitronate monooxygenase n=1 Tax=Novosphingobium marinum TaxID=1514948 RepID=A0A7Y9XVD2_9SPHN|nr:nitronate monooxygenase family protein [Novosphingobium marinum]NYH93953.1 nitronate monooxygenase [Novosphingobium marinum]GGC18529.1 2-nitropropane dioxygenase [Novosphingobium marinum]
MPVIAAPMFIVSTPQLVIAQCTAGIVGSIPSLNARTPQQLDTWLTEIGEALADHDRRNPDRPAAPFAVNLIVHRTNQRLEEDLALCEKHRVPILITSLGAREDVYERARKYGGFVFHDVISDMFGRKAIDKGADGLIAVAAGAGGHAGTTSPFALIAELRRWFDGPIALSGCIATGGAVLAAEAIGADFAYVGSAFIATEEANADDAYKQMIVSGQASDIVYTDAFIGVAANYLKPSIERAGIDPATLDAKSGKTMSVEDGGAKAWRDIWGSGQGIAVVESVVPAGKLIARLESEYRACRERLGITS